MAFTDFGIENLRQPVRAHKRRPPLRTAALTGPHRLHQRVRCSLTHAPKLVSGNTYYLLLKAPSDTVNRTYALRDGSSFGYPRLFSPTATLKWEAAQPGRLDLLGKDQSAGWRPAVLLNSPVAKS
jgi:hypothetical protein